LAEGPGLRPRGNWNRQYNTSVWVIFVVIN
jgi:hypothetical protein